LADPDWFVPVSGMFGHSKSNSNPERDRYADSNRYAGSGSGGYVESAARIHLYFIHCDLPVERRQCYGL
jgi:hypothetical protein